MNPFLLVILGALSLGLSQGPEAEFVIHGPSPRAPVVHLGRYHVLTCDRTSVVLDGARGMSVVMVGERDDAESAGTGFVPRLGPASLQAELADGERRIALDQANDPTARLEIVSQGPTHVHSRAFFSLSSADGRPYGSGTLDILVYAKRVHLIPSLFIDDLNGTTAVSRCGLMLAAPEGSASLEVQGKPVAIKSDAWFGGSGPPSSGFDVTLEQAGGRAVKLGSLRNQYPPFIYLREVDCGPGTTNSMSAGPSGSRSAARLSVGGTMGRAGSRSITPRERP